MPERNNEYVYQPPAKFTEELRQRINNAGFSDEFKQQIKSAQKEEERKMFERLTHRDSKGDVWIKDAAHVDEQGQICMLSERLAAYEDSGLSPQEVVEIKKYLNMWIEICKENNVSIVQFKKWAEAEQDGRLVVLPCKVGTRVWVIGQDCDLCHDMYTEEPCLFGDCEYRKVIESVFLPGMTDEFGKTVFFTREEAEKALQEGAV